ncbi:MAG: hypothetical protein ACYS9Y_05690, partial [Planctomycetota bacterium]
GDGVGGLTLAVIPGFSPSFFHRFLCVTKEDGTFSIGGLLSGEYLIKGDLPSLDIDVKSNTSTTDVLISVGSIETKSGKAELSTSSAGELVRQELMNAVQIYAAFNIFEVSAGVEISELKSQRNVLNGVVVHRGNEYADKLFELSKKNKNVKLLISPKMLTNIGQSSEISSIKEVPYTAGYKAEADNSGEPEPIVEHVACGIRLKFNSEFQDEEDTVRIELGVKEQKPAFKKQEHRKDYDYQIPLPGAYFSTDVIAKKNEPVVIGWMRHDKPSLYLVMTASWQSPLKEAESLVTKLLLGFEGIEIEFDAENVKNKEILVCFFDIGQRPSRHCVRELAKKAEKLKEKGITIVAVQASKVDKDKLDKWVGENNIGFVVGMVEGDEERTKFKWGVKSLPWLILTDEGHIVRAEGFGLGEVDEKAGMIFQK